MRTVFRNGFIGAAGMMLAASCAPAAAPGPGGADLRSFLVEGLEANRAMDIEFARAIPDSAMRWAPNDEVRDFAEQVGHAANNYWLAGGLGAEAPAFDNAVFDDRDALIAEVNEAYDWILEQLAAVSDEDLGMEGDLFGTPTAKWRMFTQALEHSYWTRGQLVPYFHAHGVPVPGVTFF